MAAAYEAIYIALDALAGEGYGAYDVSAVATKDEHKVLRDLRVVRERVGDQADPEHVAAVVTDVLEEACAALPEHLAAVARPLLGLGDLRDAGRNIRHEESERQANVLAKNGRLVGDFRKTIRPRILRAMASELLRLDVAIERAAVRRDLTPLALDRIEDQIAVARQRLTHLQYQLPILPVRARVHRAPGGLTIESELVDDILDAWVAGTHNSNLAVVLGEFGSGKSASLLRLAERALEPDRFGNIKGVIYSWFADLLPSQSVVASGLSDAIRRGLVAQYFAGLSKEHNSRVQLTSQLSGLLAVIDGFDDSWTAIRGEARTHLGHLSSIITRDVRLVLSSRRHLESQRRDPLVAQLRDPSSYSDLGVVDPLIIELLPPSYAELRAVLEKDSAVEAQEVLNYLEAFPPYSVRHLFRPLLVEMLLLVPPKLEREPTITQRPLTIAELYRDYSEIVLKRDYNQQRSRIDHFVKNQILRELAGRLLTQPPEERSDNLAPLSTASVQLVVSEAAMEAGLDIASAEVSFTTDFIGHNHLLVARSRSIGSLTSDSFEFSHPTFFEHFAAEYLLERIEQGETFSLPEGVQTEAFFDSLIPYFLKARLQPSTLTRLRHLAQRRVVGSLDRLLALYLLEDDGLFLEILDRVPTNYREFLAEAAQRSPGFFIWKAVRYQRVLLTRSTELALDYVEFVRRGEDERDTGLEEKLLSSGSSPDEFLLRRLENPQLAAARPITIYRLGQFGGATAYARLRVLADEIQDAPVKVLLTEALKRIEARLKEDAE